jgi:NTP pyrophosphatase (non-canonical NTP hydrolase)
LENTKNTKSTGTANKLPFQCRVLPWGVTTFGKKLAVEDKRERNHRFIEEALELVQACDCTIEEVLMLLDRVYSRDVGEKKQEVGGVMISLALLCSAHGIDMSEEGETELNRIWSMVDKIKTKQKTKPRQPDEYEFVDKRLDPYKNGWKFANKPVELTTTVVFDDSELAPKAPVIKRGGFGRPDTVTIKKDKVSLVKRVLGLQ